MESVDVAQIRYRNALALFDEFVRATVAHPDAATLRGLERRFAERVLIQPSYWSQIKARGRQIGERLARQFEERCGKPHGWMDQPHGDDATPGRSFGPAQHVMQASALGPARSNGWLPNDDDERFIIDLVLSYYRRDPVRARQRLLDLLGEVLTAPAAGAAKGDRSPRPAPASSAAAAQPDSDLWAQVRRGVAPLKRKR